jgi:polysaccharide pyruvyl transferase WcaK-like protein
MGPTSAPAKGTRIALFGIFGIENIGNECTLQAMLHNVRQRQPDADVYGICYQPRDTLRRHGLTAVPISSRHGHNGASGQVARPGNRLTRVLRILSRRVPSELAEWSRAWRVLRGTRLLVMTGTGMLTDYNTWAFGYPYDVFKWAAAARLAGCKVRFVGIGVGPVYERLSRWFIKGALALADYRSYRDHISKRRLDTLGFDTASDPVVPDLAFSLPPGMLPDSGRQARQQRVVGLGVMNYFDPRAGGPADKQVSYRDYLDKMCEFTTWLIGRGYVVRILQGDVRHDASVRRDLRAALEHRGFAYGGAGILDEDSYSVEDLLAQLALTDIVVSPRFHNLILALMLGKPVISISYDAKNDALLDGFGLGRYCQPIDRLSVARLIDQFIELEVRAKQGEPVVRQRTAEYRNRLDEQYRVVLRDV